MRRPCLRAATATLATTCGDCLARPSACRANIPHNRSRRALRLDHPIPTLTSAARAATTLTSIHAFSFPTSISFGPGARRSIAPYLREQRVARPLVVTDRGLAALPVFAGFLRELGELQAGVFSGIEGNPTRSQAMEGASAFRTHRADAVIGVGGGAALDVAKAVALMAVHEGDILEYAWDHPAVRPITAPLPCLVAVPTTSGTGSEVGRSAVISDDVTHVKKIIFSPMLLAKAVFADPELTIDLPPAVTAATGMDALTHNVESYLSPAYHPICDGIALEGARIAARALPAAVRNGHDLAARSDMMMASMMGAIAFQKDLGAVHSCAHALSTVAGLHHGLANGIMIDHVMRFNLDAAAAKLAELARIVNAPGGAQGSDPARAQAFIDWLVALKRDIGVPGRLAQAGGAHCVSRADVPRLVEIATADICHRTNPRPCTADDFRRLFEAAL
ncbi:MAG: iron-containing alcohol dehydrogenase [Proteobacteria bacterium]|nr:iron-containing alcohol dehydrogenase [Pseudomonadota bacterium]